MSRRRVAEKRSVREDVKFGSILAAKFVNKIMERGKKSLAQRIFYGALDLIEKKHKTDAFAIFNNALENVKPHLEVTSIRVGGANYQVPAVVDERRGYMLATRWLIMSAQKRSERSMSSRLAEELFEAANSRGASVKKKEDTHKMAEANRAFAHFAVKKGGK